MENANKAKWPRSLTIGAGSIGGVYYPYMGAWAKIIEKALGVPASVQVTGGPNNNIQLTELNDLDLGGTTMGPAWEAWNGQGAWTKGIKYRNFRAIFPMYDTYSFWWAFEGAGITSLRDLEGKVVGVGPTGGTPGTYHPLFLQELGIKPKTIRYGGASDLASQHLDRQLDANSFASGIPAAVVMETAAQRKIVLFGVDGADRDKIVAKYPFWSPTVIPAKTFGDWQNYDVPTVGMFNFAIANKNLPDDLVYLIVKAVFDNQESLVTAVKAAVETVPKNVTKNTFLPMHPGAIKYYEDIGIKLPAAVYPPEYKR